MFPILPVLILLILQGAPVDALRIGGALPSALHAMNHQCKYDENSQREALASFVALGDGPDFSKALAEILKLVAVNEGTIARTPEALELTEPIKPAREPSRKLAEGFSSSGRTRDGPLSR